MSRKICANIANEAIQIDEPQAKNEYQQYFFPSVTRKNTFLDLNVFQMKYPRLLSQMNVAITLTCTRISILMINDK